MSLLLPVNRRVSVAHKHASRLHLPNGKADRWLPVAAGHQICPQHNRLAFLPPAIIQRHRFGIRFTSAPGLPDRKSHRCRAVFLIPQPDADESLFESQQLVFVCCDLFFCPALCLCH